MILCMLLVAAIFFIFAALLWIPWEMKNPVEHKDSYGSQYRAAMKRSMSKPHGPRGDAWQ